MHFRKIQPKGKLPDVVNPAATSAGTSKPLQPPPSPKQVSRQALYQRKQRQLRRELKGTKWSVKKAPDVQSRPIVENVSAPIVAAGTAIAIPAAVPIAVQTPSQPSMIQAAIANWPTSVGLRTGPELRATILDTAITDLQTLLSSSSPPTGQDLTQHTQVLEFLQMQRRHLGQSRMESAGKVAAAYGGGRKMGVAIMRREREWVRGRVVGEEGKERGGE